MSSGKKVGIAVGAALAVAGASVGGYMLVNRGDDASESAEASANPSAEEAPDEVPPIENMAEVIPEKVDLYVAIPSVRGLAQASANMQVMNVGLLDLMSTLDAMGASLGKSFGLDARDGGRLISSFKSVAFAFRFDPEQKYGGFVVHTDKPAVVAKWLGTTRFKTDGKVEDFDKYQLDSADSGAAADDVMVKMFGSLSTPKDVRIVLVQSKGLLLAGTDSFLTETVALAGGKGKALASSASFQKDLKALDEKPRIIAYAPQSALDFAKAHPEGKAVVDGFFRDAAPVLMGLHLGEPGMNMVFHFGLGGDKIPKLALPKPPKLDLAASMPADALGYVAVSTKLDMSGADAEKRLVELFESFDPDAAKGFAKELDEARDNFGFGMAEFLDAIGDQLAVGFVTADEELSFEDQSWLDFQNKLAVVGLQQLKDEAAMKKIVNKAKGLLPFGETHSVSATDDGGFEAKPKGTEPFVAVRYPKGNLFVGVGAETLVKKAHDDIVAGTKTLAADKARALGLSAIPGHPHVLSWYDVSRFLRKPMPGLDRLEALGKIQEKIVLRGDNRFTMTTAIAMEPKGEGYRFRLDMLNSAGVLPALGIYGVRRYLASSKASEAKNTIGAISRGAAAAYERERATGGRALCKSAPAVPAVVPAGKKYQPNTMDGNDFETGDAETGWKCLKFSMTQPHYYQYGYSAGGPYKGPAVGGPDPGKNGYEVWAVGDLDGDGVTSLFTVTGTIDPATGNIKRSTQIFIHNELE